MALFGKGSAESSVQAQSEVNQDDSLQEGPSDSAGGPPPQGYLDLGALYLPPIPGLHLRAQFDDSRKNVRQLWLVTGTSAIRVSVLACPRSGGVWPEVCDTLKAEITSAGGEVSEISGRYGTEIQARLAVTLADGSKGLTPMRLIGIEGPRWLARFDIQGPAASGDDEQMDACHDIIDSIIINRGKDPRIRLEVLPLRIPTGVDSNNGSV